MLGNKNNLHLKVVPMIILILIIVILMKDIIMDIIKDIIDMVIMQLLPIIGQVGVLNKEDLKLSLMVKDLLLLEQDQMVDHKHLLMVLMDLDQEPPIKIMFIMLEITGLTIETLKVIDILQEIIGLIIERVITMLLVELMVGVKLLLYLMLMIVKHLVGDLKKLMLNLILIKIMIKPEIIGLLLKTNMDLEVLEINMDLEDKPILDLELWVLKMLMLPLNLTETDLKTVLEVKKDLWPNLNIKIKNILGTTISMLVTINMVIGTELIIGIIKLNQMDIPKIWLKVKVGLLVKLIKIMDLLLLVMVLKVLCLMHLGLNKKMIQKINGIKNGGEFKLNNFDITYPLIILLE